VKVFRGWHARQQALDVLACGRVSANGQFRIVKLDFLGTKPVRAFEGRHRPTYDIKHNRTQPHAHLGTRRRDPSHTVAVNQIGRAVCGLCFDNPERSIADLGPTFRDLSIGTLALCALFDRLAAA